MKSAMELFCKNCSAEPSSILEKTLKRGSLRLVVVEVDGKEHVNFGDVNATELWSIALSAWKIEVVCCERRRMNFGV